MSGSEELPNSEEIEVEGVEGADGAEGGEGMINKNSMRSTQVMQAIGTPSQIASAINLQEKKKSS